MTTIVTLPSFGHDPICLSQRGEDVQLMHFKEHSYQPKHVEKSLSLLNDYINGSLHVSEHFMQRIYEIIEGGILMRNLTLADGDSVTQKTMKDHLCHFIREKMLND